MSAKGALISKQETTGRKHSCNTWADCNADYQIKPEANVAAPDTSTWPLLLKVDFLCEMTELTLELRQVTSQNRPLYTNTKVTIEIGIIAEFLVAVHLFDVLSKTT